MLRRGGFPSDAPAPADAPAVHPRPLRRSILAAALVAVATWWGLGLPYSLLTWLLDDEQLRWVLICYAWEVPACGLLGPVLFPLLWFRRIERLWDAVFGRSAADPATVSALEAALLDFPRRSAGIFLVTSLAGYGVGALQVRLFAQLPVAEVVKILALGVATGLVGGLFAFLYLERLFVPLLREIAVLRGTAPPAGRRVPLYAKVFASALVLTLTAILLLGPVLYGRAERILEKEVGARVLAEVDHLATDLAGPAGLVKNVGWWRTRVERMRLGPSGYVIVLDGDGRVAGGSATLEDRNAAPFRPAIFDAVRAGRRGVRIDRAYTPRIVAFAPVPDGTARVVGVARRSEFAAELARMRLRGGFAIALALTIALLQGFLLSRRLIGPIEVVTRAAGRIARTSHGPWERVLARTNDEVGELATAFNQMTLRLEELVGREQAARAEAEQANRTKDEFLATLSHELRAPLQSVLSWAALLRGGKLTGAKADRALDTIARSARHQARLIDDLLDVSRIESGKLEFERARLDLADVVRGAVEELRPAAEEKGLVLGCSTAAVAVVGDARRLHQVVANLLSNAVKFTPEGGRVTVDCSPSGTAAVVRVSDTGQGINAEFLPRVFDRFSQAEGSVARRHGGLGLGLAIARSLVELHGGRLEAASHGPGQGATFTMHLPRVPDVVHGDDAAGAAADQANVLAGLRVLIVDDDAEVREAVSVALEAAGAEATTAGSVEEALVACARAWPSLVVSDLSMPGEDGYAFIRRLRATERGCGAPTPAIAVTGLAGDDHRELALRAGFTAHLAKPVEPGALIALIAELCRTARAGGSVV
jgi:signal transduction histidine kinase/ActR/RegA family two-component response regulator